MSSHLKNYIGSQLRIHRRAAGLNQAELGAQIERTAEAISNIETGKSLPSIDTLLLLAAALGTSVTDFLPEGDVRDQISVSGVSSSGTV
jgi:transcriptional regulator with XRE-family HTH domain